MKPVVLTPMIALAIALMACEQRTQSTQTTAVDDAVLARVGDSTIRQSHLDVMLQRVSPEVREAASGLETKLLQGMVRTRALAIAAEQQLSDQQKQQLQARVDSYRDELLAQAYIERNLTPQPVTAEMVQRFYQEHQTDYSVPGKLGFEVIATTTATLDDAVLEQVLEAFVQARTTADWKAFATTLEQNDLPLSYRSAKLAPAAIDNDLRAQLERLQPGQVSDVVYGDTIYVARVIEREADTLKPLHQVSVEIRKKLAPQQLKQALAQHIDQAMQQVSVEYSE